MAEFVEGSDIVTLTHLLATFRLQYEDGYEYKFSVLSMLRT